MKMISPQSEPLDIVIPTNIHMVQTTTGVDENSVNGYGLHNLAFHVSDHDKSVHENRAQLLAALSPKGVNAIHWVNQVHGNDVLCVSDNEKLSVSAPTADALITTKKGRALAIMTADCLPVLLWNDSGEEIAAIHAGWKGLANGVIESTVAQMTKKPTYAWIGAAIHQHNFEVGAEVKEHFVTQDARAEACFTVQNTNNANDDKPKYLADLPALAQLRLQKRAIKTHIYSQCSYDSKDFYSYRQATHLKQLPVGRMASIIWIT